MQIQAILKHSQVLKKIGRRNKGEPSGERNEDGILSRSGKHRTVEVKCLQAPWMGFPLFSVSDAVLDVHIQWELDLRSL